MRLKHTVRNTHLQIASLVMLVFGLLFLSSCTGGGGSGSTLASSPQTGISGSTVNELQDRSATGAVQQTVTSQDSNATSETMEVPTQDTTSTQEQNTAESKESIQTSEEVSTKGASLSNFEALSQYPELPNGCEITSLAAVFNYLNMPVDKTTLSDVYLPKAPVGQANFYECFVGDPRDEDAFGCYAPVIVQTANAYLSQAGSNKTATDITGSSLQDVLSYIDQGIPVVIWATRYMEESYYSVTWNVGGQDLTWRTPEHCMVLVGYDTTTNTVQVADPMVGEIVSYDMDLFETRYKELFQQAVVIN